MTGPADDSARIMREARTSLERRRAGHRPAVGRASAELRRRHRTGKLTRIVVAIAALILAAMVAGVVLDGIGFEGLFLTVVAIVAATVLLARYPRLHVPARAELNRGDVRSLVGRTELWLEARRQELPTPARALVDRISGQLDALGPQLEGVDAGHPAVQNVRSLVGEHLSAMVDSYCRVPAPLRGEDRGGRTADQQLTAGLDRISAELDEVTRQIAAGDLDSLAIRGRYLDYRYGGELDQGSDR